VEPLRAQGGQDGPGADTRARVGPRQSRYLLYSQGIYISVRRQEAEEEEVWYDDEESRFPSLPGMLTTDWPRRSLFSRLVRRP
jgi:hypothetical protein